MKLSKNGTFNDKEHEEMNPGPKQKKMALGHLPGLDNKYISKYLFHLFLPTILNLHQ